MFKQMLRLFRKKQSATEPPPKFPEYYNRTAILVIHGIGAQKPYSTLDQFARGLFHLFGGKDKVQQQVRFRSPQGGDPIGKNSQWTQTFLRLTPLGSRPDVPERVVDVFEYYWAPVITDLVTATQSLRFLLFSALTPFQYLRDNLMLIDKLAKENPETVDDIHQSWLGRSLKSFKSSKPVVAFLFLLRELARMLFIFLPLMALCGGLYYLIAQPLLLLVVPHIKSDPQGIQAAIFTQWPLQCTQTIWLALTAVRYLFLAMTAVYLFEEFYPGQDRKTRVASPFIYRISIAVLFLVLLFTPAIRAGVLRLIAGYPHIAIHLLEVIGLVVAIVLTCSKIFWATVGRAFSALGRHKIITFLAVTAAVTVPFWYRSYSHAVYSWIHDWIAAPLYFVRWDNVARFALLGILIYFVNGFLKSAVGGLAVYLGADALSKNNAARELILDQGLATLLDLFGEHDDLDNGRGVKKYDRVLIAAHSLGTVISYDMLNRLIIRQEAGMASTDYRQLKGMLTFGSPLNKVIYFFSTRTSLTTTVLNRILFMLHPFRLRVLPDGDSNGPVQLQFPYPSSNPPPFGGSDGFRWRNAYSPFDLISGKMFFYEADDNRRIERGVTPWTAHLSYWENPALYDYFAPLFDPDPPRRSPPTPAQP